MDTLEPQTTPQTNRQEKDERKGAGFVVSLLNKLGLGGAAGEAGAGAAGTAGSAGIASGLLATKTGIVALIVAGTTVAAGIGVVGRGALSGHAPSGSAWSLFPDRATGSPGAAGGQAASATGASSSLDYLQQAVKGDAALQKEEQTAPAEAPAAGSASADAARPVAPAPDNTNAPANVSAFRSPAGKLQKGAGFSGQGGGSGGSLSAQAPAAAGHNAAAGTRVGALSGMSRGMTGVTGARRALIGSGGMRASDQAISARNVGQGVTRSHNPSMQRAGTTFDGGSAIQSSPAETPAPQTAGGPSVGARSRFSPDKIVDQKQVPAPPPASQDTKDSTPYKTYMWIAIAALALATILMYFAGSQRDKANVATDPVTKASLLGTAATISWIAAGVAAVAMAMGVIIWTAYGQTMQGIIFTAVGGLLAAFNVKNALDFTSGSEKAKGADKEALQAAQTRADAAKDLLNAKPGDADLLKQSADADKALKALQDKQSLDAAIAKRTAAAAATKTP